MKLYYKVKIFWRDFCTRWQRFKCGYSYGDVWNMNDWFRRTISSMLLHLYHNHVGVPMEFENNPDGWKEVLNEMITCLHFMDEDVAYAFLGFCDYKCMTKEDYENVYKIMEENKNRFFELFSKYFYDLWD